MRIVQSCGLALAVLSGHPACGLAAQSDATPPGQQILAAWEFNQDGNLEGWQPNGHVAQPGVTNGVLSFGTRGSDPIFDYQRPLDIRATPWQAVELRLRADADGLFELFWSNTKEGRYGGFSQEKTTRFAVRGDGQWHTVRVFPFWQSEGRIVRLRLDPYDGAHFELDALRVVSWPMPAAVAEPVFNFQRDAQGWQAMPGAEAKLVPGALSVRLEQPEGFVLAPPCGFPAEDRSYVTVALTAAAGQHATLLFASDRIAGLHTFSFPIQADGQPHTYCVDLLAESNWRGRILALGLRLDAPLPTSFQLQSLQVTDLPQGPARPVLASLAVDEALPRAGRPVEMVAIVANRGGQTASNLVAQLTLPGGVSFAPGETARRTHPALGFDEELEWRWRVQAKGAAKGQAGLRLECASSPAVTGQCAVEFSAPQAVAASKGVPRPVPVRGPAEVGVYYFPGWQTASQWHPIRRFPERKPVLGWYAEGNPEIMDWQIKWAVEHGITFFAFDWYWSRGARQLEHGLHDAYFHAQHRDLLKFCLLWANHNAPGSSSQADCVEVTRFWIANYFRRPEHFTVDGRPLVIIFAPGRLSEDLGHDHVKAALDAMRAECRAAGVPEAFFAACIGSAGEARSVAEEGYDAVTAYNWPGLGLQPDQKRAPFAGLISQYHSLWEQLADQGSVPLLPPISGGWDSRPWHGDAALARIDRTPAVFEAHLRSAADFLASHTNRARVKPVVIIEAWNEWGEGSYIEPHREYGFGYLDAVRRVFGGVTAPHTDLVPADVGLGPYEVATPPASPTAWRFDRGVADWNNVMDLAGLAATNGVLRARSSGNDPAFFGPPFQARASDFGTVRVKLRLTPPGPGPVSESAQLFWRTSRLPESEASSVRFPVTMDGQWHDYAVRVGENRRWRGIITRLRLDPANRADVLMELESIALAP